MGFCGRVVLTLSALVFAGACTESSTLQPDAGDPANPPDSGPAMLHSPADSGPDAMPVCGDGVMQWGEDCDDGRLNSDVVGVCGAQCRMVVHWTRNFNGTGFEANQGEGIAADREGNVAVIGWRSGEGRPARIWLCKYDVNGTPIWTDTMSSTVNSRGLAIASDAAGTLVAGGSQETLPAPQPSPSDAWVRKLDRTGRLLWLREHDGPAHGDDAVQGISFDSSANVIAVGFETGAEGRDAWIRKYDRDGNLLWTRTHDGGMGADDQAHAVAADSDDGVIVAGIQTSAAGRQGWVRKYDAAGTPVWTHTMPDVAATGVALAANGSVYVSGSQATYTAGSNVWLRKLDGAGQEIWTRSYDGFWHGNDAAFDVRVDFAGDVVLSGTESVNGQSRNVWVRKYAPSGAELWTRTHNGYASGADQAFGLTTDGAGNVIVVGAEEQSTQAVDVWVRKYGP